MNYKGHTIKIEQEVCGDSPREWDNLGTMVCAHRRYELGDKNFNNGDDAKAFLDEQDIAVSLPLYLYDHSGITMNTTGFTCPWDSGQVGIIFVSRETILKEYGWKKLTKERITKLKRYYLA